MENLELIRQELQQAGKPADIAPELLRLDGYRITSDSQLEEEDFLLRMQGTPCFPRRDLTAITGQAKSGKTLLVSMLMAAMAAKSGRVLEFERVSEQPLRVMWIDTEQSPQSTLGILKNRVAVLMGDGEFPEEQFFVFNIRGAVVSERYDLLATAVEAYRPDIVILDNVRDLMTDINNGEKAQELIEQLMLMATNHDCNITCVIHQNRSSENRGLRGWLGTELMNKVFEVYCCEKLRGLSGGQPVFSVEQTMTRKYDIGTPLCFRLGDDGLPVSCEPPKRQPRERDGRFASTKKSDSVTLNSDYIVKGPTGRKNDWSWDLRRLFTDAMADRALMGYQDLLDEVMRLSHIESRHYCEKVVALAGEQRVVRRDQDKCGRPVVFLLPPD